MAEQGPGPLSGQLIRERYQVEEMLGRGGMGAVYKAKDTSLKRSVAVKVMSPQKPMSEGEFSQEELQIYTSMFRAEALRLASLKHASIPHIYEHFEERAQWFLVMEFIKGETLESYLGRFGGCLPEDEVLQIGLQLADVLHYLHEQNPPIIFRDLKPVNVMLAPNRQIFLIDFGIARVFTPGKSHDTFVSFTPGFAAPEQLDGSAQTEPRTDIYNLGATLYYLLARTIPSYPIRLTAQQYPQLIILIAYMLEKVIANRPASMGDVREALRRMIEQTTPVIGASVSAQISPVSITATQPVWPVRATVPVTDVPSSIGTVQSIATPPVKDALSLVNHQPCFLCAFGEAQPCAVSQLEGMIIAAHEAPVDGEMTPWVTLKIGEAYASITLTRSYRELVKGLCALPKPLERHRLTLRVYHLPPVHNTTVHGERSVDRYRADDYTLAILEPDTMLNITDLNQAEYCARQYLLGQMAPSAPSTAALRGNLVHACFKELLKEQDQGRYTRGSVREEEPLAILHRHLDRELVHARIDLALLNTSAEAMREEVEPHLESLANWFNKQRYTLWDWADENVAEGSDGESARGNLVRAETFLLAPEVGLRGRLDLLWQKNGRRRLLELKTGGASGSLPRSAHRWQVQGYHTLLTVRRESRMKNALATLLYSGTPQEAQDFGIRFSIRQLQKVNATRNLLVLSHASGIPPAPPGVSRCTKCALQDQCTQVSALLGWQPPALESTERENGAKLVHALEFFTSATVEANGNAKASRPSQIDERYPHLLAEARPVSSPDAFSVHTYTKQDRAFFAKYYRLLQKEGYEVERQQAMLWQTPVEERVELGSAINNLIPLGEPEPTSQGEWQQVFRCINTSELRVGDEILLSAGNPVTGEVVSGTILEISAERVKVWTPEKMHARPTLLDRYAANIVHVRTVQNLLRWLQVDAHMRGLVSGELRPDFNAEKVAPRPDFNDEQNLAVARALQMRDYLLVHGPPGTGKTSVIAEIVKRLYQRGKRVLLAGFTNQAVDNMLLRLEREGFHDYIRLGHERSVDEAVLPHLLQNLSHPQASNGGAPLASTEIRELMRRSPVIASTTATWSSDKYMPAPRDARPGSDDALWQFDVALIDEAGQLTIPAILGALRFAQRFILVGDEKQLPPLVLNKEANEEGLGESLFSHLKQLDEEAMLAGEQAVSACVPLRVQYRMHETISNFASRQFYRDQLHPHVSVARRRLNLLTPLPDSQAERGAILQALSVERPMVFLNVRGERSAMPEAEVKLSNAEARVVRETISGLLARGVHEDEIGVIAPYRAQVANLRRHLFSDDLDAGWTALPSDTPLSIDTVDRFQGGERSIIIISFATSTTPSIESQLREHLTNPNRLNVALTRAQRKLILVGNAAALDGLPIFHQLLAYCRNLDALFAL